MVYVGAPEGRVLSPVQNLQPRLHPLYHRQVEAV